MQNDLLTFLEHEVKARCERPENFFGTGIYDHVRSVVKNAVFLAKQTGADQEVVAVAAWLHDLAAISDYAQYEKHHIWGARLAEDILSQFDYPGEKLELVKACIENHRGSVVLEKTTLEERCVADADAISHFDSVPSLFYLAYVRRKLSIEEGKAFVIGKLERSYKKLSAQSKEIYKEKYTNVMATIDV